MSENRKITVMEIVKVFCVDPEHLEFESELLESGMIDSLNVLQIIAQLEGAFEIRLGMMDVTLKDFSSCKQICELIERSL